jgi:hypothetical protein
MAKKHVTIDALASMIQRGFSKVAKKHDFDKRFDAIDKRFDAVEDRLERIENR